MTMHGGGAVTFVFTNRIFIFIENMSDSVIRQAGNDQDAGLHFFQTEFQAFLMTS